MPHIHNDPGQHDHTVSAYIVRTDLGEPRALLHMHRKLNKLLAIGGHIELDETPWQAMAHELKEEAGYSLEELDVLQPTVRITNLNGAILHPLPISINTHTITKDHSHSDMQFAFEAHGEPSMPVAEGESMDLRWLSVSEMNNISNDMINPNTRDVYNFVFSQALKEWKRVRTSTFEV